MLDAGKGWISRRRDVDGSSIQHQASNIEHLMNGR